MLLNIEIIYAILFQLYEGATFSRNNFWVAGELFLLLVLNYFQGKNKATYYLTICLNLLILPDQFCEYWAITGNNLLHLMPTSIDFNNSAFMASLVGSTIASSDGLS